MGWLGWGLGVKVRVKGIFPTTNPLSHFFILWLGVAPNFSLFFASFGPQAVGRFEKLGEPLTTIFKGSLQIYTRKFAPNSLRAETRKKTLEN